VQKKGIEYAIRAVAKARERHPENRYEIIGDGPLRGALEKLVAELGLKESVILHGTKDSEFIRQRMAKAHVLILASVTADNGDQEGTPVTLMEAQASGLPVLSTRHSGIPEVVLDGKSGFLVPERDVEALAERLAFLVEHPEVCRELGACGRKHIEAQFDLRQLNRDLVRIYEQTAGNFSVSN
jgi:colanic acid/amylovoran biosynthesis glycosyltransferase